MLTKIHQHTKGWIAWTIAILIALTFVAFGFESFFRSGNTANLAATVNGVEISTRLLDETTQRMVQRLVQEAGPDFTLTPEVEKQIRSNALDNLIANQVLLHAANKLGFIVGQNQAEQVIRGIPAFQEKGQFSEALFQQVMTNIRKHPQNFIHEIQQGTLINQLRASFVATEITPESHLQQAIALTDQARDYDYLIIKAKDFTPAPEHLDTAALKTYFQSHRDDYQNPEQVKLNYVILDLDVIEKQIRVSDEAIATHYQQNPNLYTKPARWQIAHLPAKSQEITAIKKAFAEGQSFEAVAKQYSQDPLSAKTGGVLPWLEANKIPEAWRSYLNTENKIIGPIDREGKSEFIKILAKQSGKTTSLAEVKSSLKAQLKREQAQKQFSNRAETLANEAYQNPDSLEDLGLPIQTSDWLSLNSQWPAAIDNPKVRRAAFNLELIEQDSNSDLIPLSDKRVMVLRVKTHRPASPQSFEQAQAAVKQALTKQRQQAEAKIQGEKYLKTKTLPKDLNWTTVKQGKRFNQNVPSVITRAAFKLTKAAPLTGLTAPSGDYILIKLNNIKAGSPDSFTPDQREAIQTQLQTNQGLLAFELYQKAVLDSANIKIH